MALDQIRSTALDGTGVIGENGWPQIDLHADGDGGFLVAFTTGDGTIGLQRFGAADEPTGKPIVVADLPEGRDAGWEAGFVRSSPRITELENGNLLVTWSQTD
ncbi:hypothetical protein [Jannaschia aquimarina]|uniref:Uncharacterized protein n=1 Tax=Jannaschia aquimarina TaxID=935700 RepID=A0A0D1EIS7_9RHOB|nr:hypothetical protein [Jannaschia aquimarina]KIT16796.1 hypothetical protein jaqu_15840 [Jannaschia aquimarina]SNS52171.1 hypothetical protein SAMN05421775_101294 [Jannaschia aquimarina]